MHERQDAVKTVIVEQNVGLKRLLTTFLLFLLAILDKTIAQYIELSIDLSQCLYTTKKFAQAEVVKMEKSRSFIAEGEASENIATVSHHNEWKIVIIYVIYNIILIRGDRGLVQTICGRIRIFSMTFGGRAVEPLTVSFYIAKAIEATFLSSGDRGENEGSKSLTSE